MVSKNNKIKKMEEAAERQNHFSIRKLTIGAASVLLGTTLWLGTTANVSHAETSNGEDNQTPHEATTTDQKAENIDSDTKVVVNANGQNQTNSGEQKDESAATDSSKETTSAKTTETNAEDAVNNNNVNSSITDQNNQNKDQAKKTVINNNDTTKNAENKVTAQNNQQKVETSKSSSQNDQASAANQVQKNAEKVTENAASLTNATNDNKSTATTENNNAADNDYDLSAAGLKGQLATDSTLNAGQALKLAQKANAASVSVDNTKLTAEDAKKIAALYGTSLIQKNDKTTAVTDWSGVEDAYNSGESSVTVSGNIDATSDLDISRDFTIEGADKTATINLNNHSINNNGNLTLKDITINGTVYGNGTVNVEGTVTSNADASNSTITGSTSTVNDIIEKETGLKNGAGDGLTWTGNANSGWTYTNWYKSNITASKVNVAEGATLNINRSVTGDGISEPDHGIVSVGVNAKLNINLKDATTASRANEQSSSMDNASAGVRILTNGTFTTGDSAEVNINAGHGRAVVIDEPFGGTSDVANNTSLEGWENGRQGDHSAQAASERNTMTLGDSTKMNITGRGGIVLGYTATFTTGDHSIIHIDNKGNGEGLLLDANSVVEVSPHSQLLMTSDGKNASGYYGGGNYIGMGQNAKFRVEHDATFRYKLTNAANNEKRPYADNFNIISQVNGTHPEVYVGNNATFDGESDYDDYFGEIFAFSLTKGADTSTIFQIDGAKYVNWEKNSQVIGHDGAGNLYYSMAPSLIDASGQKYYVFKWNNKNLNDNNYTFDDSSSESMAQSIKNFENSSDKYWTDIEHLATKYSKNGNTAEWPGHVVSGSDISSGSEYNPVDKKTGTAIGNYNIGDGDDSHTTGFDPLNSQRLVLVASTIPTQDDDTSQVVTKHKVIIQEDDTLQPGQVKLVQEGKDGLSRTTTTTYYNVDPSTGKKTLDTTKGTNGKSTTTTVIDKEQDEIIHIAPQTAKVTYYENSDAEGNEISSVGDNGTVSLSGNPVATDSDGNVEFDSNGNAIANTINYRDYASDLSKATNKVAQDAGVSADKVNTITDTWVNAVKAGTNKYDVTGLTKDAIVSAAEKAGLNNTAEVGPTEGPSYKVVLKAQTKAEQGSVKVIYHDDTDNVEIPKTEYNSGEEDEGTKVTYTTEPTISDLENKGYVYVSTEGTIPSTIQGNTNTVVTVHMKHGTKDHYEPGTPNKDDNYNKYVTRTITYQDTTGKAVNGSPDGTSTYTQTAHFTRTEVIDTVNQKVLGYDVNGDGKVDITTDAPDAAWVAQNNSNQFSEVTSKTPAEVGYENVDKAQVSAITVSANSQPIHEVVTYSKSAKQGSFTVQYIDEDDNNAILHQDEKGGNIGDSVSYSTADEIKTLTDKGYVLDHDGYTNQTTINNDNNGKVYQVTFKHGVKDGKVEQLSPTETIHFVYSDGTKAADDIVKNAGVQFTRTPKVDAVNGQIVDPGTWNKTSYTFDDGQNNVPQIDGYTADKSTYGNKTATPTDLNVEDTVTYTKKPNTPAKDQGSITVNVHDTTDNVDLPEYGKKSGTEDAGTSFTYDKSGTITDLENKGYKVINPEVTIPTVITKGAQNVTIYVEHTTTTITPDKPGQPGQPIVPTNPNGPKWPEGTDSKSLTKTGTQTVHYVYEDGSKAADDNVTNVTFDHSITYDNVTGKVVSDNGWTPSSRTYTTVKSPTIDGYTPDITSVGGETVTINTKTGEGNIDKTYVVTYKKTPVTPTKTEQNAKLTVIDETESKTIANYSNTGLSGDPINFGSAESDINNFLNNGYVWDAAKTGAANYAGLNIGNFDNDSSVDQSWTVYLKHGVDHVTPDNPGHGYDKKDLDRTVTTTVNYVDQNGNKLADSVTNSQEFKGEGYFDKVTGGMVTVDKDGNITGTASELTWTPESKSFDAIPAKTIDGYTYTGYNGNADPNLTIDSKTGAVSAQTMNHQTADSIINIVYTKTPVTPAAANGSVKYIDDVTGNTIESATFSGKVGDKINYTTADRITYYEGKGYELVSNNFKDGDESFSSDQSKNNFEVHLTHGYTPVNPDHPDDKDGYTKDYLDKTITTKVHYEDEQGNKLADDITNSQEFKGEGYLDNVTGGWVTVENGKITGKAKGLTWTPEFKNFDAIPAKSFDGYTIKSVSGTADNNLKVDYTTGAISAQTMTRNTANSEITIVYAKKNTPVTPVAATGSITYVDQTTGNTLESATFGGNVGDKINYTTADRIAYYEGKGYDLVSNDFKDGNETFAKDVKDNTFKVVLKHATVPVTPDKPGKPGQPVEPNNPNNPHKYPDNYVPQNLDKTVTRDVTYVYEDGSQALAPVHQSVEFKGQGTLDLVTGNLVNLNNDGSIKDQNGKITWTPENSTFDATNAIDTKTYQITKISESNTNAGVDETTGVVASEQVNPTSQNSKIVITLAKKTPVTPAKDQGSITVTVHDTTDNVDLPEYGKNSGTQDTGTKFEYDKNQVITDLTNKGYKVINPEVTIPTEITKGNQNVVIYVEHTTTTITPDKPGKPGEPIVPTNPDGPKWPNGTDSKSLTKTGTQTVHYVGAGDQTPKDNVTTIEFDHSITYDNVTGKVVTDNGWTPDSRTYTTITTPTIKGYTPDKTYVGGETVTIDPKTGEGNIDKTYTVTYTKDQTPTPAKATGSVTYIDDTTKSNLKVDNLAGNVGDKIDYTTAQSIKDYEDKGYELVSNNFRDGQETFAKDGNTFEVHLKHATETINPNNPGKPGEPINPNYPDGPKWGSDTDKSHLQVEGSQTIHYTGAGDQIPKDSTTTIDFNHEEVIDKVTGKVVEDHGWTITDNKGNEIGKGESHTFDTENVPSVPGYTPDKTVAGGKTATVDNPHVTDTVNYNKNSNPTQPTQPSQPTSAPSNPTSPTTPSQPTTVPVHPEQPTNAPSNPTEPTTPAEPTNIAPHPETPETTPEAQPSNVAPHGETVPVLPTNNVAPKAAKASEGRTYKVAKTAEPVQAIHANKQNASQNALPQTGEDNNEDVTAAVLGGLAASLSLIGLAGVKKRRHN